MRTALRASVYPHDTVASNQTNGTNGLSTTPRNTVTTNGTVGASTMMMTSTLTESRKPDSDKNTSITNGSENAPTTATVTTGTKTQSSQDGLTATPEAGVQSSPSVTANMTTQGGGHKNLQPTQHPGNTTGKGPTVLSLTTPANTQQPTPGFPQGPGQMTTASRSSGTTAGHTCPSLHQRTATTLRSSITSQDLLRPSRTPAITGTSSSVPGTPSSTSGIETSLSSTLQPTPSSGPVATSSVRTTTFSTQLAPTSPKDSNVSIPHSVLKDDRITCTKTDRSLNESMLILNLTKTVHCARSPLDDKVVTLLCRAAKSTFNLTQDQCHIELVVSSASQEVAVKDITITSKFLLKDVFESLKDQGADLKKVGVNNVRFEGQGPPEETEDRFSTPLIITIVCMASFLLLVAALYGCCHQRLSQRKDQQRLTEELQTVENGYHDNPTLEVMETSSEMQEKKVVNLNGELGDSWIVPLDNLTKDDLDEEEDTHL
ncbi:podocalyxin isoform X2 [Rousettus aegyptiacus]|uniref:podocalyxin isoform X2 n=1 Tax=Rousettus aegyptiacus TaxID=9407 RepID=UPI00168CD32C|nr:podocalyxin isoform X2 [Rousettus aegyptiacus]